MDAHDAITFARRFLFEAGGLQLQRDGNHRGSMVAIDPNDQPRADAYNALAELHLKYPEAL